MNEDVNTIGKGKTPGEVYWSLVAGFLAWGLDLGASYPLVQHVCAKGHVYLLHVITVACLLTALSGIALGWRALSQLSEDTNDEGGTPFDRAHFQALLGMGFSTGFALVVIAGAMPRLVAPICG
jgi:hypothetical protein